MLFRHNSPRNELYNENGIMTSLPYPTFEKCPASSYHDLSSVGRCRISPASIIDEEEANVYRTVLSKCIEHTTLSSSTEEDEHKKKTLKKLYKESVGLLSAYLTGTLNLDVSIVDVEVCLPSRDVLDTDGLMAVVFLDAGASHIVLDATEAMQAARIPPSRLIASLNDGSTDMLSEELRLLADTVSVNVSFESNEKDTDRLLEGVLEQLSSSDKKGVGINLVVHVSPPSNSDDAQQDNNSLEEWVAQWSQKSVCVTLVDPTPTELGLSYAACCRTDRSDGLYTTVVCTRSGEALGLVYSSKESIIASLECPRAVYYSRSRKSLWRKGDTSGHFQILHRIDTDCDGDALRFTVTQMAPPSDTPAFCHLHTLTCWGRPHGLRRLEETLLERLQNAPEGSYTKRLFDDEELLQNKLVEEAQELSEADTPKHVAEELADVLYFAMVRAVKAKVSMDDATRELDSKARKVTRRKGDSKTFRIQQGNDILEQTRKKKEEE